MRARKRLGRHMRIRRVFTALGTCLLLAACADVMSPPAGDLNAKKEAKSPTSFDDAISGDWFMPHFLRQSADAPPLQTYNVQFWAKRGEGQKIQVDYLPTADSSVYHFLKLEVPNEALLYRPDGTVVEYGDSVLIEVNIDPELLLVRFAPHGMIFSDAKPVKLRIYYELADRDLNGDGKVTKDDFEIEKKQLGMGYQPVDGAFWQMLGGEIEMKNKYVEVTLRHFSNYAIAW